MFKIVKQNRSFLCLSGLQTKNHSIFEVVLFIRVAVSGVLY